MAVVAEGIEDPLLTAERLAELGCPLGQGYFYGKPQPVSELTTLFAKPPRRPLTPRRDGDAAVVASGTLG